METEVARVARKASRMLDVPASLKAEILKDKKALADNRAVLADHIKRCDTCRNK